MFTIYALAHPETGEVRYIGQTCRRLRKRIGHHLWASFRANLQLPVYHWIRKHGAPEVVVLNQVATKEMANILEQTWIRHTPNLLNLTDGGEGTPGCKRSPENIAKTAQVGRRIRSADERRRLSEIKRNDPKVWEHCRNLADAQRGKPLTAAHKAALEASRAVSTNKYRPTPEHIEKLRASARRPKSAEHKAKLAEAARRQAQARCPETGVFLRSEVA